MWTASAAPPSLCCPSVEESALPGEKNDFGVLRFYPGKPAYKWETGEGYHGYCLSVDGHYFVHGTTTVVEICGCCGTELAA